MESGVNYGNLAEASGSGKAILHETQKWSNIKQTVDIKHLAEWSGHDCERILFMVKKNLIIGVSMQVLEQKFILLSTLFLSFAIILKQNKLHCTNQENANCIGGGGGWIWPHCAFLPWAQDKGIN